MNILFVHEVDWLKKVVYEIHTLSELLSLAGHNVYAIDYESMWTRNNLLDFGSLKSKEINVARAYPKASVKLIRSGFIKIPILSRITAFFTQYWTIKRVIKEKKIDIIILYSVPTNGLQTIYWAKKFGIPIVFRSIDILHELVPNKLLSKITSQLERIIYSKADLILTITPKLSQYIIKMKAPEEKVKLLPLGVDTKLFSPSNSHSEDPNIVFVGTLPYFSGLDNVIRKFPEILKEVPKVKLIIVGDGVQRAQLEKIIHEMNLSEHILITGYKTYKELLQYIRSAIFCILPFNITKATNDIFPAKIIQYLACGKPVLCASLAGLMALIKGEEQGVVYYKDSNDMTNKAILLFRSEKYRRQLEQAAINYIKQTHDYNNIVQQLEIELNNLTRSRRNEYHTA